MVHSFAPAVGFSRLRPASTGLESGVRPLLGYEAPDYCVKHYESGAVGVTRQSSRYDAVIVGSGPNGLAAAITLAKAGKSVLVLEGHDKIGGGCRSAELLMPGVIHDVCSAIHPLVKASPFLKRLDIKLPEVRWIESPAWLAHPFDDGTAVVMKRSIVETAIQFGEDAAAYCELMAPLAKDAERIISDQLGPLRIPRHPIASARFGLSALRSAKGLADQRFRGERARAVFAGIAAHSMLPLDRSPGAAFGLMMLLLGHAVGWPLPEGGSQQIIDGLAKELCRLGGEIRTGYPVESMREIPETDAVLFDLTPKQLLPIAGDRIPGWYRRQLRRYRYGPGVYKLDWVLDGPIPWRAAGCLQAATVHLGGTLSEISAAEDAVARSKTPDKPFVLLAQPSLFDPTRAPSGLQTVWAYCHVPSGSTRDMTARIEAQIERFAPGFRDRILARQAMPPAKMQRYNPNYIGGDINGGLQDLRQLFTRPTPRLSPYTTPDKSIYICSSSTPPGGGVHGMCGYYAAQAALKRAW